MTKEEILNLDDKIFHIKVNRVRQTYSDDDSCFDVELEIIELGEFITITIESDKW